MKSGAEYYKEKYAHKPQVKKLILVRHIEGSKARLELVEKDKDGAWESRFECNAVIGRNGIGKEREGDEKTPLGDFGMICAFGIKPDPGTSLPYIPITEHTWCCGDERAYNRIIDIKKLPHVCRGEHMADYVPEYNYGLFFDFNKCHVPGMGFAVFLHCTGEKEYTGGCIAVDEMQMIRLLKITDCCTRVCIF